MKTMIDNRDRHKISVSSFKIPILLTVIGLILFIYSENMSADISYEIINDTVIINISDKGMITQTPYILTELTNRPIVTFTSYLGSEQCFDIAFLFNTTKARPTAADYYYPRNITTTYNYTCDYNFSYTLDPKYAWCYETWWDEENQTWHNHTIFEHSFDWGNISTKTIWWNITVHSDWLNINDKFNSTEIDWLNYTRVYYITNITFQPDETKTLRPTILLTPTYPEANEGKYAIFIKRCEDTLQEAWQSELYVYLDPWWNNSWSWRYDISGETPTINMTMCVNGSAGLNGTYTWYNPSQGGGSNYYVYLEPNDSFINISIATASVEANYDTEENGSTLRNNPTSVYNAASVYHLDEEFNDSAGNDDGTGYGDANKSTGGLFGNCYEWHGSGAVGAGVDDNALVTTYDWTVDDSFTLMAWFKYDNNANYMGFFGDYTGDTGGFLRVRDAGGTGMYLSVGDGAGSYPDVSSGHNVNDGHWHLITWVYDNANENSTIYDNETLIMYLEQDYQDSTDTLTLGCYYGASNPDLRMWDGWIDEFRVYDRALTLAEINATVQNAQNNNNLLGSIEQVSESNETSMTLQSPSDASSQAWTNWTLLNISVEDSDGEVFNITFYNNATDAVLCDNDGVTNGSDTTCNWTQHGNGTSVWYVIAVDYNNSENTTSDIWSFITRKGIVESIYDEDPANMTNTSDLNLTISVTLDHEQSMNMTVHFWGLIINTSNLTWSNGTPIIWDSSNLHISCSGQPKINIGSHYDPDYADVLFTYGHEDTTETGEQRIVGAYINKTTGQTIGDEFELYNDTYLIELAPLQNIGNTTDPQWFLGARGYGAPVDGVVAVRNSTNAYDNLSYGAWPRNYTDLDEGSAGLYGDMQATLQDDEYWLIYRNGTVIRKAIYNITNSSWRFESIPIVHGAKHLKYSRVRGQHVIAYNDGDEDNVYYVNSTDGVNWEAEQEMNLSQISDIPMANITYIGGGYFIESQDEVVFTVGLYWNASMTDHGLADDYNRTVAFFKCEPWFNCTDFATQFKHYNGSIYPHVVGDDSAYNTSVDGYIHMTAMSYTTENLADSGRRGTYVRFHNAPSVSLVYIGNTTIESGSIANVTWYNLSVNRTYRFYVNVTDGINSTIYGNYTFETVESSNTAPTLTNNDTYGELKGASVVTTEDIIFNITCTDPDAGDNITGYLEILNGSTSYANTSTSDLTSGAETTLYTLSSSNTQKGETWMGVYWCGDTIENSSSENDSVTIANSAPVLVTQDTNPDITWPYNDIYFNITCTDKDSADTITGYLEVQNGSVSKYNKSSSVTNGTETKLFTLASGNTSIGETWKGIYWCGDGTANTSEANDSVTILDNRPTLSLNDTNPDAPRTMQYIYFNITCIDSDNASIDAYLEVQNGSISFYNYTTNISNNTETTLYTLGYGNTSKDENWTGIYWCGDGDSNSSKENDTVTIADSPPSTPTNLFVNTSLGCHESLYTDASGSTDNDSETITYLYRFNDSNASSTLQGYGTNNTYWINSTLMRHIINTSVIASTDDANSSAITNQTSVINSEPTITLNHPSNGELISYRESVLLNVTLWDVDGDLINASFFNNANTSSALCTNNSNTNGSYVICNWTGLVPGTGYNFFINGTDNESNINKSTVWSFSITTGGGSQGGTSAGGDPEDEENFVITIAQSLKSKLNLKTALIGAIFLLALWAMYEVYDKDNKKKEEWKKNQKKMLEKQRRKIDET